MNPDAAFLANILAHPDDEGPRLIYADYLDDLGDPRGSFIRVQCALERLDPTDPRRDEFFLQEQHLLARHREEWLAPLRGLGTGFEFRRGFVEEAKIESRVLLNRGEVLFAKTPIRHLQLLDLGSLLQRVMSSPLLARVSVLNFYAQHLGEPLVAELASSPHLGQLRGLNLCRNRLGDKGVETLLGSTNWQHLTRLDLRENTVTDRGAMALAESPRLPALKQLILGRNELRPEGFTALLGGMRLESLDLWNNRLGDYAAAYRPPARLVGTLRELVLCHNGLTPASLELLTAACDLPELRRLDLGWNHLANRGVEILTESSWLRSLRSLTLRDNQIGGEGVRALAQSARVGALEELSLGHNPIYGPGAEALLYSEALGRLRKLELSQVHLSVWVLAELTARFGPIERGQ